MRIVHAEVEFAGDQEGHRSKNRRESPMPVRLAFGGMEEAVYGFKKVIDHATARLGKDAFQ